MDTLSLMTLILAAVTFFLAVAAFWTIWQNYAIRKEDRDLEFKIRLLDEIIEWARKTRVSIIDSLNEYRTQVIQITDNMEGQLVNKEAIAINLESQIAIHKAKLIKIKTKNASNVEISNLDTEMKSLQKELRQLQLKEKSVEKNEIKLDMMMMLKESVVEFDFLNKTAYEYGEYFNKLIQYVEQSLGKMIESLDSDVDKYITISRESMEVINRLSLEAFHIKLRLIRYGSKIQL